MIRIGVDIGGTFTDFAAWREGSGETYTFKTPTTPPHYERGFQEGFVHILERLKPAADEPIIVLHGTTITTNTVIERKGADIALLVTGGFRDLLEIERMKLPDTVNLFAARRPPLVPRNLVFEVDERLDADGSVVVPIDLAGVVEQARRARDAGTTGCVVAFLHSYTNASHELAAREAIQAELPDMDVTLSSEVWPCVGEFERTLIALLNCYVKPRVDAYLKHLQGFVETQQFVGSLFVTRSNGGAMAVGEARAYPVQTLLSGPASGVAAAQHLGQLLGENSFLTMDMGGTSTDLSLVVNGRTTVTNDAEVGDFPLVLPVTGIEAIGAGGGSIARLDQNVLRVGPQSAGANPGPACFGRGGVEPTVTDAYLLSGFIDPQNFLGGRMQLDAAAAQTAMAPIADELGCNVVEAAEACITVATSNMVAAVLPYLARNGVDPEDLTLVVYGGAGSLHGPLLASEVGINRVLIPRTPSVFCAHGGLVSDLIQDEVAPMRGKEVSAEVVSRTLEGLATRARQWLADQADAALLKSTRIEHWASMRYLGQSFEINVMLPPDTIVSSADCMAALREAFNVEHERLYSHCDRRLPVEITELRVRILGSMASPGAVVEQAVSHGVDDAVMSRRSIQHNGRLHADVPVYDRERLGAGHGFPGPAIVEQNDTTILVPVGFEARVLPSLEIMLVRGG